MEKYGQEKEEIRKIKKKNKMRETTFQQNGHQEWNSKGQ